ncbi:MAG: ribbon-helix-helix protein, CopG family [Chloroflexota bacterium]
MKKQSFDQLSGAEREVVGNPADYEWNDAIDLPARSRPESVQFSLRVERETYEGLQAIARERHVTFSDVARDAIARYVRSGGKLALTNVQISFRKDQGMLVQIAGGRAEMTSSRRLADPNERALLGAPPVTS